MIQSRASNFSTRSYSPRVRILYISRGKAKHCSAYDQLLYCVDGEVYVRLGRDIIAVRMPVAPGFFESGRISCKLAYIHVVFINLCHCLESEMQCAIHDVALIFEVIRSRQAALLGQGGASSFKLLGLRC